jgi:hypothetical protein
MKDVFLLLLAGFSAGMAVLFFGEAVKAAWTYLKERRRLSVRRRSLSKPFTKSPGAAK